MKNKYFWIGMLLMLVIVLPWHVYESIHYGAAFWQSYLFQQVVQRGAQAPGDQPITAMDYFKDLWYEVQPWVFIFLVSIPAALCLKKDDTKKKIAWFGFLSAIALFVFFLVAQTKIFTYLLPIFPFMIIFIGATLFGISNFVVRRARTIFLVLACGGILLLAFWNTANDAFVNYPSYFAYLWDEKAIGLKIAAQDIAAPIFMYDWVPNNTMMFYSGQSIGSITTLQTLPASPDFLILSAADLAGLVATKPLHRSAAVLYEGQYLSLLEVK